MGKSRNDVLQLIEELSESGAIAAYAYTALKDAVNDMQVEPEWKPIAKYGTPEEKVNEFFKAVGIEKNMFSEKVLVTLCDKKVVSGEIEPYEGDRFVREGRFSSGKFDRPLLSKNVEPIAWMDMPGVYKGSLDA